MQIARHAEGVPLYARELAWLTAKGPDRLVLKSHYRLLSSPNRLNAAMLARLDAVGDLKQLAQVAAVLGRVFETRVLAAMLDADPTSLRERLDALVARGILLPAYDPPGAQYRFSHTLLWSAAYGSVLKSRRRQLHARAANEFSTRFPELSERSPERPAHHFAKAGDHASAFTWWRRAALQAHNTGQSTTAVAHIDRALTARKAAPEAGNALEEAELHSLLGKQLSVLQGSASAETQAAYQRALGLLSQLHARPADLSFDIQWGLCTIHLVRKEITAALETSTGMIEEARTAGRNDQLIVALRLHGTAKLLHGCVRDAIDLYRMIEAIYDPSKHGLIGCRYVSDQGIVAAAHMAWATAIAGETEASLASQRKGLTFIVERDHPHTTANVLGVLATAAKIRGDAGAAAALAHACLDLSERQGFQYWTVRANLVLGWVEGQRDPVRGLSLVQDAVERYRKTGSQRAGAFADCIEAEIALRAGKPGQALVALARSESSGGTSPRYIQAAEILRLRALALVAADPSQRQTALTGLERAEAIATEQGALTFARRAAEAQSLVSSRRGMARFPRPVPTL